MLSRPVTLVGRFCGLRSFACAIVLVGACTTASAQTILYNQSFADGTRTSSSGVVQPVYAGASTSDNATYFTAGTETLNDSVNTVSGKMQNLMGNGSRKNWFYFTPDQQPPDANNPPTDVLTMTTGQTLTASMTFVLPTNVYTQGNNNGPLANHVNPSATPGQSDFRFGLFYDTNNARILADTNNDSGTMTGGPTSPWADSTGYGAFMGVTPDATRFANPQFQLTKRTNTSNVNLVPSSNPFTLAARQGTGVAETLGTQYTVQMVLHMVSATQMDVTSNMYQGTDTGTLLSTAMVSDLGTGDVNTATFGNVAINGAQDAVPGNSNIYKKFDQFFFRLSGGTGGSSDDTGEIDIQNFKVSISAAVLRGDMNFDGHVNAADIAAMQKALTNLSSYLTTNFGNGTPASHGVTSANIGSYADVNGGTNFTNSDAQALLVYLKTGHGSTEAVPEPASLVLGGLGAIALGIVSWRRKKMA